MGCVEPKLLPDEDAVAVLLPDDLVLPTGVLEIMSKVRAKRGGSVLCAIEVPADEISAYGVFDVEVVPDAANPNVLRVKGMVEKPKAEDAPSLYAAAGRYVLDRAIFDALRRVHAGCRRRDPADRRHRPAHRGGPSGPRRRASRIADTTWEIPAATSRLRLTLRWNVTTTDRSCGAGWSSDWAWTHAEQH